MLGSAVFSRDGRYRYALRRVWDDGKPAVLFVGLNPSTADAHRDDATIRRCARFARDWGFGQLLVGNLFAFRTSSPRTLRGTRAPVGPNNDRWLRRLTSEADVTVAAWGNSGVLLDRDREVLELLEDPRCLEMTKRGCPKHPLYVRASARPRRMRA
jgi:hypothetical protein